MTSPRTRAPQPSDADDGYNLAARVYGDGDSDDEQRPESNGPDGNGAGSDGVEPYNLAARVYGNGRGGDDDPRPDDGDDRAAEPYNLAARVYGNGRAATLRASNGDGASTAVAATAVAPPYRAGPPGPGAWSGAGTRPPGGGFLALRTFESLHIPAFRWFLIAAFGQWASMNMQNLLRGYLVFQLTGSYAMLGVMALMNAIPWISLSLVGGVVADRMPKKYVMQAGQTVNALNALVMALLLFFDMLRVEHLLAASFVQGAVMSLAMPSRQAMTPELVGMDRLMNGVALSSAVMNTMRLVAPASAGLIVAGFGAAWAYFLIVGLYLLAILTLTRVPARPQFAGEIRASGGWGGRHGGGRYGGGMGGGGMGGGYGGGVGYAGRVSSARRSEGGKTLTRRGRGGLGDIVDGVRYVANNRLISMLLIVNFFIVMTSMPYMMMLPGFVAQRLDGDATRLGVLMGFTGIGALVGSLVIASMPSRNRGKLLLYSALLLGISLVAFAWSTNYVLSIGIMLFVGLGQQGRMALTTTMLQWYVEDEYRGRVMSLYMMEFGLMSLGVFFMGLLAEVIGPEYAIGGAAVVLVMLAIGMLTFLPSLRNLD